MNQVVGLRHCHIWHGLPSPGTDACHERSQLGAFKRGWSGQFAPMGDRMGIPCLAGPDVPLLVRNRYGDRSFGVPGHGSGNAKEDDPVTARAMMKSKDLQEFMTSLVKETIKAVRTWYFIGKGSRPSDNVLAPAGPMTDLAELLPDGPPI